MDRTPCGPRGQALLAKDYRRLNKGSRGVLRGERQRDVATGDATEGEGRGGGRARDDQDRVVKVTEVDRRGHHVAPRDSERDALSDVARRRGAGGRGGPDRGAVRGWGVSVEELKGKFNEGG